jgi:hypothetical protein
MQLAAERFQDRQHLGEAHGGLPAFQFDQEAKADSSRRSQLILTQASGEPSSTNHDADLFDRHSTLPIGNIYPFLATEVQ